MAGVTKKGRFVITNLQDTEKIDVMIDSVAKPKEPEESKTNESQEASLNSSSHESRHDQTKERQHSLIDTSHQMRRVRTENYNVQDKEVNTDDVDTTHRRSEHYSQHSESFKHHECDSVPASVLNVFQDTLSSKVKHI